MVKVTVKKYREGEQRPWPWASYTYPWRFECDACHTHIGEFSWRMAMDSGLWHLKHRHGVKGAWPRTPEDI